MFVCVVVCLLNAWIQGLDEDDLDTPIKVASSGLPASRSAKMSIDTIQLYDDVARLEKELGLERKQTA